MLETIITEAFLFLSEFSFTSIHDSQDNTREGGGYLFNSSWGKAFLDKEFMGRLL